MRTVEAESSTQQIWKSDKRVVRVFGIIQPTMQINSSQISAQKYNFNICGDCDYAVEPDAFAQLILDLAVLFLKFTFLDF